MSTSGHRFTIERRKLCIWLEVEKRKIQVLPRPEQERREQELEREFRTRLDRLYGDGPRAADGRSRKLN